MHVTSDRPRLFLTYSHDDNETGNFEWVVQELEKTGVQVEYDEIVLVPGRRMWPQIEKRILEPNLRGWGVLLTSTSLRSQACLEELEYARLRALNSKAEEFPLIGLVDRVPVTEIPLAIRSRLYLDLKNPTWNEKTLAALRGQPSRRKPVVTTQYQWRFHRNYAGDPELVAVEAGPRYGSILHFAMVFPQPGAEVVGVGAANGGTVSSGRMDVGTWDDIEVFGEKCKAESMKGPLDPGISGYAVFRGVVPRWVAFGACKAPFTLPIEVEKFTI